MERELTARLLAVVRAIPLCESVVDCGCDHGYVSIAAMKRGVAKRITASDINRGPLLNAQNEINKAGLSQSIKTVLTDGLCGIDMHECVVIAGMGGETIVDILSKCAWIRDAKALVLQPMTKSEILREYLYKNGFSVYDENIVAEGDRLYAIISARYCGEVKYLPFEKYISRSGLSSPLAREYTARVAERLSRELHSRVKASAIGAEEKKEREENLASLMEVRKSL